MSLCALTVNDPPLFRARTPLATALANWQVVPPRTPTPLLHRLRPAGRVPPSLDELDEVELLLELDDEVDVDEEVVDEVEVLKVVLGSLVLLKVDEVLGGTVTVVVEGVGVVVEVAVLLEVLEVLDALDDVLLELGVVLLDEVEVLSVGSGAVVSSPPVRVNIHTASSATSANAITAIGAITPRRSLSSSTGAGSSSCWSIGKNGAGSSYPSSYPPARVGS